MSTIVGRTGWIRVAGASCYVVRPKPSVLQINHLTEADPQPEALDLLDELMFEHKGSVEVTNVVSRAWAQALATLDFGPIIDRGARTATWICELT